MDEIFAGRQPIYNRQLAQNGYIIALDDFVYRPELEPLAELQAPRPTSTNWKSW